MGGIVHTDAATTAAALSMLLGVDVDALYPGPGSAAQGPSQPTGNAPLEEAR